MAVEKKDLVVKDEEKKHLPAKPILELSVGIIKKYICPTANDAEAYIFLQLCKTQNLNPFIGEAYLIKYGSEKATMVTGKYTFAKRAENHPDYDGMKAGLIVSNKEKIEYTSGSFVPPHCNLIGSWAEVYRKDQKYPVRVEVSLSEYMQKSKDGKPFRSWARMLATMIRKVALLQAWREAFPNELGGLYGAEEMAVEAEDVKITDVPEKEIKPENDNWLGEKEMKALFKKLEEAGIATNHFFNHVKKHYNRKVIRVKVGELKEVERWIEDNKKQEVGKEGDLPF